MTNTRHPPFAPSPDFLTSRLFLSMKKFLQAIVAGPQGGEALHYDAAAKELTGETTGKKYREENGVPVLLPTEPVQPVEHSRLHGETAVRSIMRAITRQTLRTSIISKRTKMAHRGTKTGGCTRPSLERFPKALHWCWTQAAAAAGWRRIFARRA